MREEMKEKTKRILKNIKYIVIIITFICAFICNFFIIGTRDSYAVSGHGTSHSSSSHSSSHSSKSSSSHTKRSSSSHSSSRSSSTRKRGNGSSSSPLKVCIFTFIIVVTVYICLRIAFLRKRKMTKYEETNIIKNDTDIENKIKEILPNFNKQQFINDAFNIFVDIQNAWTNLDITPVQDKLTDELFSMYQSQIDGMELKGEKNVMKDMNMLNAWLKNVSNENGTITITTGFIIDQIDYMANIETGKVTSGSDKVKMRVTYDMKFRITLNSNTKIDKCPNCGADISNMNSGTTCEYCGSKIIAENTKWVLTELTVINQK